MSDDESQEFKVVDRRSHAHARENDERETTAEPGESKGGVEPPAEPPAEPAQDAPDAATGPEGRDELGDLPDPVTLLSLAALQLDARSFARALIGMFDRYAWQAMGLVPDPATGEPVTDMQVAQFAIDCVQFLLGKLQPDLSEADVRECQRRINDLRMNYVARQREK